jgi:hypothetical protein
MKSSIYKMDEPAPSKKERAGANQDAVEYLRLWKNWAHYATAAFFLSCASVTPFSAGFPLHAYAEPFGRLLVYLSMALLIPFVVCVGVAINSWFFLRALKKGKLQLSLVKIPSGFKMRVFTLEILVRIRKCLLVLLLPCFPCRSIC